MASKVGLALRREAATTRLRAAVASLSERHGFNLDHLPIRARDAELLAVLQLEGMASLLEQLIEISVAVIAPTPEPAFSDEAIQAAYARYDADARVHGPEDVEAFADAVRQMFAPEAESDGEQSESALTGGKDEQSLAPDEVKPPADAVSEQPAEDAKPSRKAKDDAA